MDLRDKLQRIKATAEKATKGPWEACMSGSVVCIPHTICKGNFYGGDTTTENAAHIASADPSTVIALCDALLKIFEAGEHPDSDVVWVVVDQIRNALDNQLGWLAAALDKGASAENGGERPRLAMSKQEAKELVEKLQAGHLTMNWAREHIGQPGTPADEGTGGALLESMNLMAPDEHTQRAIWGLYYRLSRLERLRPPPIVEQECDPCTVGLSCEECKGDTPQGEDP